MDDDPRRPRAQAKNDDGCPAPSGVGRREEKEICAPPPSGARQYETNMLGGPPLPWVAREERRNESGPSSLGVAKKKKSKRVFGAGSACGPEGKNSNNTRPSPALPARKRWENLIAAASSSLDDDHDDDDEYEEELPCFAPGGRWATRAEQRGKFASAVSLRWGRGPEELSAADSSGRPQRRAKVAAMKALDDYADWSREAKLVRQMGECVHASVRVAKADGNLLWFCLPRSYAAVEKGDLDDGEKAALGEEVELNLDQFEVLFGADVVQWLKSRVKEGSSLELSEEAAYLWGLTDAKRIEWAGVREYEQEGERRVKMVVPADRIFFYGGAGARVPLPNGVVESELEAGCFYGCNADGPASWYSVLMYTLEREKTIASDEAAVHATVLEGSNGIQVSLASLSAHEHADELFLSCISVPNRVWRSDLTKSRPSSSLISDHLIRSELTLAVSSQVECAKAAVVNAIRSLGASVEKFAIDVAVNKPRLRARNMKGVTKWVEKEVRYAYLEYPLPPNRRYREVVSVEWIVENTNDILLVNLIGTGSVRHMVCVDCREGIRRIYDCAEMHPINLSEDALRCCVGDGIVIQRVEARRWCLRDRGFEAMQGKKKKKVYPNSRKRKRTRNHIER